jgi:hypothetical protein
MVIREIKIREIKWPNDPETYLAVKINGTIYRADDEAVISEFKKECRRYLGIKNE